MLELHCNQITYILERERGGEGEGERELYKQVKKLV
jgi:hypothetical protein